MQELEDSQSDADQCRRLGVDEKYTKLRPSPKNMKKFIQRKIDYSESHSPSDPADQLSPSPQGNSPDRSNDSPPGQPPLPRGPPPDSVPSISRSPRDETKTNDVVVQIIKKEQHQEVAKNLKPTPTVCRDFIRGSCTRPGCKFAHEYDLSQLRGVYTFCHNYQNTVCTYPNCKFVHATVFEEAEFYRTGVLPPHAIAHHKNKNAVKLLPPPPPPPDNTEENRHATRKPPVPALQTSLVPAGLPVVNCSPDIKTSNENGLRVKPDPDGNFPGSPRPAECNKQKCSNCGVYENRLRHSNQKVESLKTSIKNIDVKMAELDAQERRMNTVIRLLLDKTKNGQIQDNNYGPGPSNAGF